MKVFLCYDGDSIGHRVGKARMADDAIEIARVSQLIDKGNDIFRSFALENGGQVIQIGGDEGAIQVDAKFLESLEKIRDKYESITNATVSVGIGKTISEAFKALIVAKLRGKNRSVLFDNEIPKEIEGAEKEVDSEQKKIVDEYLGKADDQRRRDLPRQFRSGNAGANTTARSYKHEFAQKDKYGHGVMTNRESSKPKINHQPAQQSFTKIADNNERKDRAISSKKTSNLDEIKQKVGNALAAMHQQLPVLQQIKQASPETYTAIVGVIDGVIALGRQLQTVDKELEKSEIRTRPWVGAGIRIPAKGTKDRANWDNNYRQAAANHFTEGKAYLLKPVTVDPGSVSISQVPKGGDDRSRLYQRMVKGNDDLPPIIIQNDGSVCQLLDGHHRLKVALSNNLSQIQAYERISKSIVPIPKSITNVQGMLDEGPPTFDLGLGKADLLPGGQADNLSPLDFDPEALAIGTQHEMEHTDDEELAREIAMDHLAEDKDYYKKQLPELLKDGIDEINNQGTEPISNQELDPNAQALPKTVLDKGLSKDQLPTTIKPLKSTSHLIPGQVTTPRHIVATVKGKPIVRAVGSGMKRDLNGTSPNPIGPGMGNPVSARKKLSNTAA